MTRWLRRLTLALILLGGISTAVSSFVVTVEAGSAQKKTVHVKGYTKKDGTKVEPYDRQAPKKKSTKAEPATAKPAKQSKATKEPAVSAASATRDGNGRIKRSAAAKHAFEVESGYPHGRPGYVVDHIKPLACGGTNTPSNMQWQTVAAAKAKDKVELAGCR